MRRGFDEPTIETTRAAPAFVLIVKLLAVEGAGERVIGEPTAGVDSRPISRQY